MVFRAVNWTPTEMLAESKMTQLSENANFLYRNTPRAIYVTSGGVTRAENVKIAAGQTVFAANQATSAALLTNFGNFFSSGCEPNITTGIVCSWTPRLFCTITGTGGVKPTSTGMKITIETSPPSGKTLKLSGTVQVNWTAIGY